LLFAGNILVAKAFREGNNICIFFSLSEELAGMFGNEDGDFDMITAGQGAHFYRFDSFEKVFKEGDILVTDAAGGYTSCTAAGFDNNGQVAALLIKGSVESVFT
jgi:hypothetical protein